MNLIVTFWCIGFLVKDMCVVDMKSRVPASWLTSMDLFVFVDRYRVMVVTVLLKSSCTLYYIVLYYTILYYTILYYTILYYSILYYIVQSLLWSIV